MPVVVTIFKYIVCPSVWISSHFPLSKKRQSYCEVMAEWIIDDSFIACKFFFFVGKYYETFIFVLQLFV